MTDLQLLAERLEEQAKRARAEAKLAADARRAAETKERRLLTEAEDREKAARILRYLGGVK